MNADTHLDLFMNALSSEQRAKVQFDYGSYIKACTNRGTKPQDPEVWLIENVPAYKAFLDKAKPLEPVKAQPEAEPVQEYSYEQSQTIRKAFLAVMIPNGHGTTMQRAQACVLYGIKGWESKV